MNPMYSGHYTFEQPTNPITQPKLKIKFADRKGGFPHSEISGSKGARASPELIAACHVLHRLSTPRHPSEALMRLIVLSKTHAWGRIAAGRTKSPTRAHTCALYLSDNDVFSGSDPESPWGGRTNPSIHDVNRRRRPMSRDGNLFFRDRVARSVVVEPDGIEPTTSCLQSTRSTN